MEEFKIVKSKRDLSEDLPSVILIDADEKIARSLIASLNGKKFLGKIGIFGRDNNFNRRALETLKIDYLISPEREILEFVRKDSLKQRDSGLNHVLGKIAKEKGIEIVIDFSEISGMKDKMKRARRISRIIQNVKVCRRAKCVLRIWDLSGKIDKKELQSFGYSVGMSSPQVNVAVD